MLPDVLDVRPFSRHGNLLEAANNFRGSVRLMKAFQRLQKLL
jgi:hypothetical protein